MSGLSARTALLAAACLASCAATSRAAEDRARLARAVRWIDAGDQLAAERSLESLLGETRRQIENHALARFHARALLARAHLAASFDEPEGAARHLVAAEWHVARLREARADLERYGSRGTGARLLPEELRRVVPEDVAARMEAARIAIDARLGFRERAAEAAEARSELASWEQAEAWMEAVGVEEPLRPWVRLAVFEGRARSGDPRAFRFGVGVLDTAGEARGSLSEEDLARVAAWIQGGSAWRLVCPEDGEEFDPALPVCTACGRLRSEFAPELRGED